MVLVVGIVTAGVSASVQFFCLTIDFQIKTKVTLIGVSTFLHVK